MLNWFPCPNCYPSAGLKSLRDTLSARRPADLYLDLAVPMACHIPPGGSDYVLYRETGLKHYGCFLVLQHGSDTVELPEWASECVKGKEKKRWMNGRLWPRGSAVVIVESRDGSRTTSKTEHRKKKYVFGGWLEYMTGRQKIVETMKKKNMWPRTVCLTFFSLQDRRKDSADRRNCGAPVEKLSKILYSLVFLRQTYPNLCSQQ